MKTIEPAHFRDVMGRFATGVTVVTASDDDGPVGMTANAVCSLTLEELLPGGGHTIGIGAVTAAESAGTGTPLIWYRGEYR